VIRVVPDVAFVVGHTDDRPGATAVDGLTEVEWGRRVCAAAHDACALRGIRSCTLEKPPAGTYRDRLQVLTSYLNELDPALVVEVHFNVMPGHDFRGTVALHWPTSAAGELLAQEVAQRVADSIGTRARSGDGALPQARSWNGPSAVGPDGQPAPGGPPLYTLQWTRMPAIILETHFGDSADHVQAISRVSQIGEAIAAGVDETLDRLELT